MGSRKRVIPSMAQGQSHCVFSKTQKQPQCTCQANMVAGSSLTLHAALLVHASDTRYPTGDCHQFTGSEDAEMLPVKADLADIFSSVIGVS